MNLPLSKEDAAMVDALQGAVAGETRQVYSLFAVQGMQKDKGYSFEADSKREFFIAKAVGARADRLSKLASSLHAVPEAERDVLQQPSHEDSDDSTVGRVYSGSLRELLADLAWLLALSKATMGLIPVIPDLADDNTAIHPAALETVHGSPHYAFAVSFRTPSSERPDSKISLPCRKVVALVRSSKKSMTSSVGEGFKITTSDVEDLLAETAGKRYTLSAMCTVANLAQYKLDPPRGGHQDALVTLNAKTGESYGIENLVLLGQEDSVKVKESLKELMQLAIHIYNRDRKRMSEWKEEDSPHTNKRACTRTGCAPTDTPLPAAGGG